MLRRYFIKDFLVRKINLIFRLRNLALGLSYLLDNIIDKLSYYFKILYMASFPSEMPSSTRKCVFTTFFFLLPSQIEGLTHALRQGVRNSNG